MCLRSLVLSTLSPEEFQEFDTLAKVQLLFKSWQRIKVGEGGTTTKKIAMEVARDIIRHGKMNPEGEKIVKDVLQQLEKPSKTSKTSPIRVDASILYDFQNVIRTMKKGKTSETESQALVVRLDDICKRCTMARPEQITTQQALEVSRSLIALWKKGTLTSTQIFAMQKALEAAIVIANKKELGTKMCDKLAKLGTRVTYVCLQLNRMQLNRNYSD
jgi:polyhydroxyalkanoate synthesis regulator phasin